MYTCALYRLQEPVQTLTTYFSTLKSDLAAIDLRMTNDISNETVESPKEGFRKLRSPKYAKKFAKLRELIFGTKKEKPNTSEETVVETTETEKTTEETNNSAAEEEKKTTTRRKKRTTKKAPTTTTETEKITKRRTTKRKTLRTNS